MSKVPMTPQEMQKRSWKKRVATRGLEATRKELSRAAKKSGQKQFALKGPEYYRAIRQKGIEKQQARKRAQEKARKAG